MKIPINRNDECWENLMKLMGVNRQLSITECNTRNANVVAKIPDYIRRTYTHPIRPLRQCRFTHRFHSTVDIEQNKIQNCCGKWKVNNELYVYVHRIVDIGKELPPK